MLYKATYICAGLGTAGLGIGLRLFDSLHWLWQIPLLFAGLWLSLVILALLFLLLWCAPISLEKPVEEDSPADRRLLCLYSDFALSLLRVKRHITGMEKLPQHGRFLLVCNHLSILDPVLLLGCMKTSQLAFISKQENNRLPVVNKLMHKTLCQLINRDNDRDALLTILKCVDILKQDKANIAVFPEGYTSRDGHLQPFRNGVFKIAQRAKVPIVVCALRGTPAVFRNFLRLRRSHVYLDLLAVIPAEELKGQTKEVGARVHAIMAADLESQDQR